jgi:hypothetical protein
MSDWEQDYLIEYIEGGKGYTTIWSGYTREAAVEEFQATYPERIVVERELEQRP